MFSRALQASVTVRKYGIITKYNEISIDGNPLKFDFEPHLAGDTHQFTTAPLHNEAMAASIAGDNVVSQQRRATRGSQLKLFLSLVLSAVQLE